MDKFPLFIHNASGTNDYYQVKSPYNGEPLALVERAGADDIEQALANAGRFFSSVMLKMPAWKRAEILRNVASMMENDLEDLSLLIAREGGKPLKDARVEAKRAVNTTRLCADEILTLSGEQIRMDRASGSENNLAVTVYQPLGPVLAISAFNHPLNLICHQVCTAFAAGNTVIIKPASQTPLSALRIAAYFRKAGLEDGVINVVVTRGNKMERLVSDPRIRFLSFIGSEEVGWDLRRKVSEGVRVALEHGGTGSAIMLDSCTPENAISSIVRGAFYHSGQVCVSTQNLYIHTSIYDRTIELLKNGIKNLKTGDPCNPETDLGPLITPEDVLRVDQLIKDAVAAGARLICGGTPLDNNCYAPTLLADTGIDMAVMSKEVFGPVLSVLAFSDLDQVINEINSSRYSFQTAVYGNEIDSALYCAREIDARAVIVNNSTAFRVDWMPFGGARASGLGTGGVRDSIIDMSNKKLIVLSTNTSLNL
ncbi:MAG: aldehyde dehydrogenase family protein [Candidatus Dadabacteria bacterium]|nr:MAG: aldehyde dehydrogenase family protein [Candidatus Dadabacteria bacterium]